MTSTNNSRLNDFVTQEETCDDITQEKNNISCMFLKYIVIWDNMILIERLINR